MSMIKIIASRCRKQVLGSAGRQSVLLALPSAGRLSSYVPSSGSVVQKFIDATPARHASGDVKKSVWKLGRLNHIAIAVPDLSAASAFYRDVLRARVSAPQDLPSHGVTTVFVELDNTKLELLHPLGDNSPIAKYLERNKSGGLHHVCLEVPDIDAAVASISAAGIRCLSKQTTIGAHGKPVMFLHPADCHGVLVELEQA